jgi:hypothetical protein
MENNSTEETITQLIDLLESDPGLRKRLMKNINTVSEIVDLPILLGATKTFLQGALVSAILIHGPGVAQLLGGGSSVCGSCTMCGGSVMITTTMLG